MTVALGDHLPVGGHLGQRFLGEVAAALASVRRAGRQHGAVTASAAAWNWPSRTSARRICCSRRAGRGRSGDVFEGTLRGRGQGLTSGDAAGKRDSVNLPYATAAAAVRRRGGEDRLGDEESASTSSRPTARAVSTCGAPPCSDTSAR